MSREYTGVRILVSPAFVGLQYGFDNIHNISLDNLVLVISSGHPLSGLLYSSLKRIMYDMVS